MKIPTLVLISALAAKVALGECDCTIVPYKPPACFNECAGKILSKASYTELTSLFGLKPGISRKIVDLPNRKVMTSLKEYKQALSPLEMSAIETAFKNVSQERVAVFDNEHRSSKKAQTTRP